MLHQVSFKEQLNRACAFWREDSEWEVFRERQRKFCKSWNFRLFTIMPRYRLQTTMCNYFPVILGNSSSWLKFCVLLTVCSMFTMLTTTQLLKFGVRVPSMPCAAGNPAIPQPLQEHGTAVASKGSNTSAFLVLCYYWQMLFIITY